MKLVLLCAGYSTRLGELTKETPKALIPIGEDGKPVLEYLLENIERMKAVDEAVLVTNNRYYNVFIEWEKKHKYSFPIKVINDGTSSNEDRLGAIGDTIFALKTAKFNDDTIITATDNLLLFELKDAYNYFKKVGTDITIGRSFPNKDELANRFAVAELDKNNKILNIVEKPAVPKTNIGIYAVYFYKKETLRLFDNYKTLGYQMDSPGNFLTYLYKVKPVHVYIFNEVGIDVGTMESLNQAREEVKKKKPV
jgi:glucose-1-phosphate thymidylyltransferase